MKRHERKMVKKRRLYKAIFDSWLCHKSTKIATLFDFFKWKKISCADDEVLSLIINYVISDIEIELIKVMGVSPYKLKPLSWRPDPLTMSFDPVSSGRLTFAYALKQCWYYVNDKPDFKIMSKNSGSLDDDIYVLKQDFLVLYNLMDEFIDEFVAMDVNGREDYTPWKGIYPSHYDPKDKFPPTFENCNENNIDALEVITTDKGKISYISVTKQLYVKIMVLTYFKSIFRNVPDYIDIDNVANGAKPYSEDSKYSMIEVLGKEVCNTRPHQVPHKMRPATQATIYELISRLSDGRKYPELKPIDYKPVQLCFVKGKKK